MDPQSAAAFVTADPHFAGLPLLAWIPLLPLLGALINLVFGRWLARSTVQAIAIAAVAAACGLVVYLVFFPLYDAFRNGQGGVGIEQQVYTWIEVGSFKAQLAFRLDTLSSVMVLIITFVGTWIHIYSTGYMSHEPRYAAYFGYLNLFMGAMLILVLGSSLPVMFIGWEGVGLCSFLLIGFWYENDAYATAGRKAFVVNRIGDFCFLLGMFLLFWATKDIASSDASGVVRGSLDFATLKLPAAGAAFVQPFWGGERLAAAAGILLFIGASGKSAQIPLYVWLPDAMAGPTPVSALIHAATMVTAGVYMICRMSFLFSASTTALIVVSTIGLLTALAAAFMAFAQTDLKKVLAYSTVSQLGFMFVAAGTGNWTAAIFHLMTHAFFKACLFLGAGSVMHGMEHGGSHTPGDITTMGGLKKHMPITRITFLISCLAIAGIFPFSGFFSKDDILGGAFHAHPPGWPALYGKFLWVGLSVAALGTAVYMWRLYFLVFESKERTKEAEGAHESPASMTSALVVLATFATVIGLIGAPALRSIKLPGFTHSLAAWLAPSVTHQWHEGTPIEGEPPSAKDVAACANVEDEQGACTLDTGAAGVCMGEEHHLACEPASDLGTAGLLGGALGIGLLGIFIAWRLYRTGPSLTVAKLTAEHGPLHGAYEASKHKLWVDEFYDASIVRGFKALARGLFEIVDRFIIDTVAVNGAAFVVGIFARISRWFQNGSVQRYLAGLIVGAAAVFFITDCHHKATFDYEFLPGGQLHLRAEPGAGIVGSQAVLTWDLDGDGVADRDPKNPNKPLSGMDLTVPAGDVGARVTLWIEDPIARETTRVTRTIEMPEPTVGSAAPRAPTPAPPPGPPPAAPATGFSRGGN